MFFEDNIDDAKYCGHMYGLGQGSNYIQNGTSSTPGNAAYENHNHFSSGNNSNNRGTPNNVDTSSSTPTTTSSG